MARGRPAVPWESVEQWADAIMYEHGYQRWRMSNSHTGCWFFPGKRHTRFAKPRKEDFFQLPAALKHKVENTV